MLLKWSIQVTSSEKLELAPVFQRDTRAFVKKLNLQSYTDIVMLAYLINHGFFK